jgi:hypothetical protein
MNSPNFSAIHNNYINGVKYGSLTYWKEFLEELHQERLIEMKNLERALRIVTKKEDLLIIQNSISTLNHKVNNIYSELTHINKILNEHVTKYGSTE